MNNTYSWFLVNNKQAFEHFTSIGREDIAAEYDCPQATSTLCGFVVDALNDGWFQVTPIDAPYHEVIVDRVFSSESELNRYYGLGLQDS